MDERMQRLAARAAEQFGLVARSQVLECGIRRRMLRRRLEACELEYASRRGVYRFPGAPDSWHARAMELLLLCGPTSALSHGTAAYLHRLDGFRDEPEILDVTATSSQRIVAPPHRVHLTRGEKLHQVKLDGLRVTSVVRTLVDLGEQLTPDDFEKTFDSARRFHRNLEPWLDQFADTKENAKRRGVAVIKRLIAERSHAFDSALEVTMRQLLEKNGFPMPLFHYRVFHERRSIMEVDGAYLRPDHRHIALHFDGFGTHSTREQFERDAAQRTQLSVIGWVQIVITWRAQNSEVWKRALRTALAAGI